jgi:hypothetical protein
VRAEGHLSTRYLPGMSRTIQIPGGVRTLVFRRRFSSIPQTIRFEADPAGGTIERIGSKWVLGRTRSTQPLQTSNEISKGYWDTFFEIYVTPDRPVRLTIDRPRMARLLLIASLVLVVVAVAAVVMFRVA